MGVKTSVYLSDDLAEAVRASGVPLRELVRRGLGERAPELTAAAVAVEAVRDDLDRVARALAAGAAAEAVTGALDGAEDRLRELAREIQDGAVREALRQGGGY